MAKEYYVTTDVYANHGQRIANLVIDTLSMTIILIILFHFKIISTDILWHTRFTDIFIYKYFPYDLIFGFIYFTLFESLTSRSIGKYFTGTIVVDCYGNKPSFSSIVVRSLSRAIPFDNYSFLWPFGRGWHDMISKTYVVNKEEFEKAREEFNTEQHTLKNKMLLKRTTSDDADFQKLAKSLDQILKIADGEEHEFFAKYNKTDTIINVVVCYVNNVPVGCGAFKEHEPQVAEIKRMYVDPFFRGKQIAPKILQELENWAKENQFDTCILETAKKLQNAIKLYEKSGYSTIENYGQYAGIESCICMKKKLK